MEHRVRRAMAGLAIACATWTAASRVQAGTSPPNAPPQNATTREQLNPLARTEHAQRRGPDDLFTGPLPQGCELPPVTSTFTLQDVRIEGAGGLSDAEKKALWADLANRPITTGEICEIRDRVAARLFGKGILARVLIPEQRAEGVVRLTVIEAEIARVFYHGDIGPARARVEAILDHLRGLAPFRLDTAQRYLLLANDVPGVLAVAHLKHSDAPGASGGSLDLDIELSRTAVEALVQTQNLNADTTGPWTGVARLDLDSFTRLGERTTFVADTTVGTASQTVLQLIESARIGDNGVFAQASFAYGRSHPGGSLTSLTLHGDSYVGSFEIDDPVIRLKRLDLTLAGGFDIVNQTNRVAGGSVLTDDALRVLWLRANVGARRDLPGSVFGAVVTSAADLTVDLRQGMDALGASAPGGSTLSRPAGRSDAFVAREDATFVLRFEPISRPDAPLTVTAHTQGQLADKPLLAYEQQSIGNLTIGRGYDPDSASGDRAIAADFKAEVGPLPIGAWLKAPSAFRLGPYGFYDIAYVDSLDSGQAGVTLRSTGVGVEVLIPYRALRRTGFIHADVSYAIPLDKASAFALAKPPSRVLFTMFVNY